MFYTSFFFGVGFEKFMVGTIKILSGRSKENSQEMKTGSDCNKTIPSLLAQCLETAFP